MKHLIPMFAIASLIAASALQAQTQAEPIDCDNTANEENEVCLGLPPTQDATNFILPLAPLLAGGAVAAAAVAAASGGGSSTPSTN